MKCDIQFWKMKQTEWVIWRDFLRFLTRFWLLKLPRDTRSVFWLKWRFKTCCKLVYSFAFFSSKFQMCLAVLELFRSWILLWQLAHVLCKEFQSELRALKPCIHVWDFAITSIETTFHFCVKFEFLLGIAPCTNLECAWWCIKAFQYKIYPLINFFDFYLILKDLKWIKSNKIK